MPNLTVFPVLLIQEVQLFSEDELCCKAKPQIRKFLMTMNFLLFQSEHLVTSRMKSVIWGDIATPVTRGIHWDIQFYPVERNPRKVGWFVNFVFYVPHNSLAHMEMGPQFEIDSKRLQVWKGTCSCTNILKFRMSKRT